MVCPPAGDLHNTSLFGRPGFVPFFSSLRSLMGAAQRCQGNTARRLVFFREFDILIKDIRLGRLRFWAIKISWMFHFGMDAAFTGIDKSSQKNILHITTGAPN